jgi:succinate dehydrogenase flavin-adding protein (antitoxin of CptAB toxin-antitoxin module)
MWVEPEELERIGYLAQTDDKLLAMLVEWNDTRDWGEQDMILSKIVHYVKEKDKNEQAG